MYWFNFDLSSFDIINNVDFLIITYMELDKILGFIKNKN